ncbi:2-succinyl-6-hydroxy-2,4-cyclohexadiene-1-carboxylate synthase [Virgibacillus senegalensis]|uniref:2-succinyl-6-hydroxy-2, 4-cyclohexadiene-1-carboxylate synthase n=1 Tax=Virgibacillus senegalensis TaxID=1499679 RepID=UPI00069E019E|nr:2-succinyl-6-hydroxy-2,4-cyclohexadiene-1-carboxylate synthase [Virgibacillus senegalensis]
MYYTVGSKKYWMEEVGEGPPLLLLHGFTGSSGGWQQYADKWKNEFRVLMLDLPGHGKTKVPGPIRMEDFCEDLEQLLDMLSLTKVHLLGYSLGGRTALSFTVLKPERVQALVLESASPGLSSPDEQLARQTKDEALAERIIEEGLTSFVDYWQELPLFESQTKLPDSVKERIRKERLSQTERGLADSLTGMGTGAQPSWWGELGSVSHPVLLMAGEIDRKFVNIAEEMHESLQNSNLEIVPLSGHAIHVEQPQKFDTIVQEFLLKSVLGG